MEKNSAKISLGTAVCMVIILILIIALGVVYYLGFIRYTERIPNEDVIGNKEGMQATNILIENNEDKEPKSNIILKNEINEELKTENSAQTIVPTSDLVTLDYEANNEGTRIFYAYIEDGYLYYFTDSAQADGDFEGIYYDFALHFDTGTQMTKHTKLSNIKRIKTYNIGTGINPQLFLITEDGQVYTMRYLFSNEIEKYDGLADYKVEDILSKNGELDAVFEILLKDGTTTTVTVDLGI